MFFFFFRKLAFALTIKWPDNDDHKKGQIYTRIKKKTKKKAVRERGNAKVRKLKAFDFFQTRKTI